MISDEIRSVHTAIKTISEYCFNRGCDKCYFFKVNAKDPCELDNIFSKSALPFDYEENITNYIKEKENK